MAAAKFLGGSTYQFTDNSGNVLASGKIYTYVTGTTTDKATYSDNALSVANANPIILDSQGKADIYLMQRGAYRFLVKTSSDATVETIDDIVPQARHQGCLVTKSAAQTLTTAVATPITFDTESYDTDSFHDSVTNNSRITIPSSSTITKVKLGALIVFATDATSTGNREVALFKNGATIKYGSFQRASSASGLITQFTTPVLVVAEGDYFEIYATQTSGADLTVLNTCQFWAEVVE